MKAMTALKNKSKGIIAFFPMGSIGEKIAKDYRQTVPALKHARLIEVIQAHPDKIMCCVIYKNGTPIITNHRTNS